MIHTISTYRAISILILGIMTMTIFHKINNTPYNQSIIRAKEVLASFLEKPAHTITCELLTGGSEEGALVKGTYLSTDYVIKFFSTNELGKNEIAWTQHASDLGIGPKLYYAEPTGRYMLIEFAKGDSLVPSTANTPSIIKSIATTIARLHHSSATFALTSEMFVLIDEKYKKLQCSGQLKALLENNIHQVNKIKTQLQSVAVSPVPCHKDLNPGNIFTNNNHVMLIDWGDAALSDPYYDIAAFFVLNVINEDNQKLFFEQYDAKLLNPQAQGYLRLYKQLVYFEFALNLLLGVHAGKSELLHARDIPQVKKIDYYLTLLAGREVEIDSTFLYTMAIASLDKMDDIHKNLS